MRRFVLLFWVICNAPHALSETQLLLRASLVSGDDAESFQRMGTSHQRFDSETLALAQGVLAIDALLTNNWQLHAVANAYSDGEQKLGISQLYGRYRPLTSATIKPEVKIGFFYPAISAENTDMGWLSPHFLSNSAINSWIGEEVRTLGIEASIRQNGRQARSNWSWKLIGSVFKGNDTTGTLLSWRGFGLHDRQSLHDDQINFLPIPWVVSAQSLNAPAWTEPFREIDTKVGFYTGAHVAYKRSTELRYYYYDNRADPLMLDADRIYAWHTRFHSLTLRYKPSPNVTMFSQFLAGDTLMGDNIVNNDFYSAYLAATYEKHHHAISARFDWYQVVDKDNTMYDPNDSQGEALTFNYRFSVSENLALTAEWQINRGHQQNLAFFNSDDAYSEHLLQLAVTYRMN